MLTDLTFQEMLIRVGAAMLFGAVLGLDRERRDKPAGLRTHAMVCLGSTAFTLVTIHFVHEAQALEITNSDPVRLIDGLVGGIGFLGAGAIIQSRGHVEGITTASTIWVAGAVGLACGIGQYDLAAVAVVAALIVLEGLGFVKKRIGPTQTRDDESTEETRG